jgi:hypothetical protein
MIPPRLHFIWIGAKLPWFVKLAIQSALDRVPRAHVTLWATHDLAHDEHVAALRAYPRFELCSLDEATLFRDAPSSLPVDLLASLFRTLSAPAARANIARLLILARFGGVYLDTDTVTLRDLAPLYELGGFCGLEYVVWPLALRRGLKPYRVLGGPMREVVRSVCAHLPAGERQFAKVASWYPCAANNAVLGFSAGHPFLLDTLARVNELSPEEQKTRYRLGTHLLQEMLARQGHDVHTLAPPYFYPLGPELSRQYFRPRGDLAAALNTIVRPETYVIHWYASVSELNAFDEARVLRERDRTLFAHVAAAVLDGQ